MNVTAMSRVSGHAAGFPPDRSGKPRHHGQSELQSVRRESIAGLFPCPGLAAVFEKSEKDIPARQ